MSGRAHRGPDPIASSRRRTRKKHELPEGAACVLCGETNPLLLELHHVYSKANDAVVVVVLCKNHHALVTSGQHDLGAFIWTGSARTLLEAVEGAHRSEAAYLRVAADAKQGRADDLARLVDRLDRTVPGWREWKEAGS